MLYIVLLEQLLYYKYILNLAIVNTGLLKIIVVHLYLLVSKINTPYLFFIHIHVLYTCLYTYTCFIYIYMFYIHILYIYIYMFVVKGRSFTASVWISLCLVH